MADMPSASIKAQIGQSSAACLLADGTTTYATSTSVNNAYLHDKLSFTSSLGGTTTINFNLVITALGFGSTCCSANAGRSLLIIPFDSNGKNFSSNGTSNSSTSGSISFSGSAEAFEVTLSQVTTVQISGGQQTAPIIQSVQNSTQLVLGPLPAGVTCKSDSGVFPGCDVPFPPASCLPPNVTVTLIPPSLSKFGSQYMQATFTAPNSNTLSSYAASCGFALFNWQQQITTDPGTEIEIIPNNPSNVPGNAYPLSCSKLTSAQWPTSHCALAAGPSSDTGLPTGYPPYFDPPQGGFTYAPNNDSYPFYDLLFAVSSPGTCTVQDPNDPADAIGRCPPKGNFPFVVSLDDTTLTFLDAPAHPGLPGAPASTSPSAGTFISFVTSLVGVDKYGNIQPLFSWTWNSTFNGTTGGATAQSGSIYPIIPTSGTGGVTITSINGLPVSACDVNWDGATDVADVQSIINEALGVAPAINDLNGDGAVNIADVQSEINAVLGFGCVTR